MNLAFDYEGSECSVETSDAILVEWQDFTSVNFVVSPSLGLTS